MPHLRGPTPRKTVLHVINEEFALIRIFKSFADVVVPFAHFSDPLVPLLVQFYPLLVKIRGVVHHLLPWQLEVLFPAQRVQVPRFIILDGLQG